MAATIDIFCCYAREDQVRLNNLKKHLMPLQWQGLITIWSDTDINAGKEWEQEIDQHLNRAHIILLLVSPDFMASQYCYSKEMTRAMERHEQGEACVIPILLRHTYWKGSPFEKLQFLPTNAKPVADEGWHTEDDAFFDVVGHISTVVRELRTQQALAEASKLTGEGRYEEALVIYDQALLLQPENALAHVGKGEALLAIGKDEESLIAFGKATQADPSIADAHFYQSKAQALRNLRRYTESLAVYNEAIRSNSLYARFYEEKADVLVQLQRYREALETYEQCIRLEPNKAGHYQHRGELLLALRRYEEALAAYDQALRLESENVQFYQKKGEILLSLKRYKEALATYEKAMHLSTDNDPSCYYGQGQALFGLVRYEEALAAYDQALRLASSDPDPQFYHEKGIVYERLAQIAYEQEKQARLQWRPKMNNSTPLIMVGRPEAFVLLDTLTEHTAWVYSVAFSPNGQTLASGSADTTIKLWSLQTGRVQRTLTGHANSILSVAFSPDGQTLASGSADTTIKLWSFQTGQVQRTLTEHTFNVRSVAFSPDGQTFASGSDDQTIKLWSLQTGQVQRTLTGHMDWVRSVAFSPDGQTLVSGSDDTTIKLWGE